MKLEEKYTHLSEIEHILQKPTMYLGSIYSHLETMLLYKPSESKIITVENVSVNEGLLKLVDEIYTNSFDEARRSTKLFDITKVEMEVYTDGRVVIQDNGGMPVEIHKETKQYIPRMVFGNLRTSSNYSEVREGVGTNGLGSKLTNIFSTEFRVTTTDTKKKITICWKNNMEDLIEETISKANKGEHFTRFEFKIDLKKFGLKSLDISTIRILQKRVIDGAAGNIGIECSFKTDFNPVLNSTFKFNSFQEFLDLHLEDHQKETKLTTTDLLGNTIILMNVGGLNWSFVNGAKCLDIKGSHFEKLNKQIIERLLLYFKKQDMELLTPKDITNKYSLFVNLDIFNPDYDSQTKTKLINRLEKQCLELDDKFFEELVNSELVTELKEYYNVKYLAEQKKQLRMLNKTIKNTKPKKLTRCSSKSKEKNKLWLFEGTSAQNGFRKYRNAMYDASFELRGKVKNTLNLNREEILQNTEFCEIVSALGLQFLSPEQNLKNLQYNKIIIASDADVDGFHINGLLLAFFAKHFPELLKHKKIYRLQSPVIIIKENTTKKEYYFYSVQEFEEKKHLFDKKKGEFDTSKYTKKYYKGLGSLQDHHYQKLITKPSLIQFTLKDAEKFMNTVEKWFGDSAELRKNEMINNETNE